jgi:hypothetical protein
MTDLGAVSQTLEREIRAEMNAHPTLVWLDKDNSYSGFVEALKARQEIPVVAFQGSFLELMLSLEGIGNGLDSPRLLVHMPGFNEESIRETPVLELYRPGFRFRKALDTLIREAATSRVTPAEIDRFLATTPTLEAADAWLTEATREAGFGIAAALDEFGPAMIVEALSQRSKGIPVALKGRVSTDEDRLAFKEYAHRLTGIDDPWIDVFAKAQPKDATDALLAALGAWLLSVEYVHDLRRPPHLERLKPLAGLSKQLVKACCDIVNQLRRDHGNAYAALADEVEGSLVAELEKMKAEDLGSIDTFREEESRVLEGAVEALQGKEWNKAKEWAEARKGEKSFWLQRVQKHRWAWMLVEEAAGFGAILERHQRPFADLHSLEQATSAYAASAFEVDRAHRQFEQRRLALLEPSLPHHGRLQEVARLLRSLHRAWADQLCRDFTGICQEKGFLPPPSLQQRALYEQVVHPLVSPTAKTAVFLIDAFRFEMATELLDDLRASGATVDLKPRLAELPSLTSVGMNVLAPVAQGERLVVAGEFKGFRTGEFTVDGPDDRARAMGVRSTGKPAPLLTVGEVCDMTTAALAKKLKPESLVMVQSRDIDDAGEANVGLPTFESSLRQIKSAWHHLQLAGVKNFVFTADHGFLLQDETTREEKFGTKKEPSRRHVLDSQPRQGPGLVNVSVSSLGYEGVTGYILFRDDTAVFDTGKSGATFVHGGNSPQERIIPVLTVTQKRAESGGLVDYQVEAEAQQDVLGLHRVKIRIGYSRGLGFAVAQSIDLAVRARDRSSVRVVVKEAIRDGKPLGTALRVPVGDAWTEVFFALEGPDDRAQIEVYHPDNVERVSPARLDTWYDVVKTGGQEVKATPTTGTWADQIADEDSRKVFLHIEQHGSIDETQVVGMLGSPRAFRRFSLEFEAHLEKLPFRVRIEPGDGGKRYVREGKK